MGTDGSVVNDEEHKLASGTDTNGHDVLNSSGDNSEPETKQISKGTSRGKKEKRKGKARQPVMIDSGSEEEKEEMVADLLTKIVVGSQDQRLSLRFYSLVPESDCKVTACICIRMD